MIFILKKKDLFVEMPETLAKHFGHLFVRDPLVIIDEFLEPKDETTSYHFEVCLRIFSFSFESSKFDI